jgi:hypothetical protein
MAPSTVAKTTNLEQFNGGKRENHITIVQGRQPKRTSLLVARRAAVHFQKMHELRQWRQVPEFFQILLFAWPTNRIFSDSLSSSPETAIVKKGKH